MALSDDDNDYLQALGQKLEGYWNGAKDLTQSTVSDMGTAMAPITNTVDRFTGAPTRAALAQLAAGKGMAGATPAFVNQFGQDPAEAPQTKDILSSMGVPKTSMSEAIPGMYSDTGKGWGFQKGGMMDPTLAGAAALGVDTITNPLNIASEGLGELGSAAEEESNLLPFKQKAATTERAAEATGPGEVISMKDALAKRQIDAMREQANAPTGLAVESANGFKPTVSNPKDWEIFKEQPKASVTQFPSELARDPSVNPIPPGVDPAEYQSYRESPQSDVSSFNKAKNDAAENSAAQEEALNYEKALRDRLAFKGTGPKEDLSGADQVATPNGKVIPFDQSRVSPAEDLGEKADVLYNSKLAPTKEQVRPDIFTAKKNPNYDSDLASDATKNGITPLQQQILYRYGDDKMGDNALSLMQASHNDAYIGKNDISNSLYAKKPPEVSKMPETPIQYPSSATVEDLPNVLGKATLGKDVPNAFNDPLRWADQRYKKAADLLDQAKEQNMPMRINTRSDLIAHDDYISKLDPMKSDVNIYFGPANDEWNIVLNPGNPSNKRLGLAIQKLQENGIRPTLHIDALPQVQDTGFQTQHAQVLQELQQQFPDLKVIENPIQMDAKTLKNFKKRTGIE